MLTYQDNKKQKFSESDVLKVLEKCKKVCNIDFKAKEFLFDALQAVCLLIQDGLEIAFSHRSFQEYFVARFVVDAETKVSEKILFKYSNKYIKDSVLSLIYELNPDFVEKQFIIPEVGEIFSKIDNEKNIEEKYIQYLKRVFIGIGCEIPDYFPNYYLYLIFKEEKYSLISFVLKNLTNINSDERFSAGFSSVFWKAFEDSYLVD